jgi:hypothetical protein
MVGSLRLCGPEASHGTIVHTGQNACRKDYEVFMEWWKENLMNRRKKLSHYLFVLHIHHTDRPVTETGPPR